MTDNEIYDNILSHFQIVSRYQDKAQAKCPAHDDRQASLTITKGRKCVLFKCHANCDTADVLRAAGLDMNGQIRRMCADAKYSITGFGRKKR